MTRISRDEQMALYAIVASMRSTCGRRKVGSIIALEGRVLSTGYAGPPSGFPHCSTECLKAAEGCGCKRTIHAEQNAISYAARHGIKTEGATLYCTLSPCESCAKSIISAGIKRVVYLEKYRDSSGIQLLEQADIPCEIVIANSALFTSLLQTSASGGVPPTPA